MGHLTGAPSRRGIVEPLEQRRLLAAQLLGEFDFVPSRLATVGGDLYYTLGDRALHRIDADGNVRAIRAPAADEWHPAGQQTQVIGAAGGRAFLVALSVQTSSQLSRPRLWRIDPSTHTTSGLLPADVALDTEVAPVALGSVLYFVAGTSPSSEALWRSDGTARGTRPVTPSTFGNPQHLTVVGPHLYFTAGAPDGTYALFRSDGTAAGTVKAVVLSGPGSTVAGNVTSVAVSGSGAFVARHNVLTDKSTVWFARDTGASAQQVPGEFNGMIRDLAPAGGRAYFSAATATHGREIWTSDGTPAGTKRLTDVARGAADGISGFGRDRFLPFGGGVVFSTNNTPTERGELWRVVGDGAPVRLAREASDVAVFGSRIYFANHTLHVSDGTAAGTRTTGVQARELAAGPSRVFFSGGYESKQVWAEDPKRGAVKGIMFNDGDGDGARRVSEHDFLTGFRAYVDLDNDGRLDKGEPAARSTGPDGYYIGGLVPGTYTLRFVAVAGWDITNGAVRTITVKRDRTTLSHVAYRSPTATLRGTAFDDHDLDGTRDAGEPGLAGFRMFLDYDRDGAWDRAEPFTRTDAAGNYQLTGAPAGIHALAVTRPAGWDHTSAAPVYYSVRAFGTFTYAFGLARAPSVRGTLHVLGGLEGNAGWRIFADLDRDGAFDAGEPSGLTDNAGLYAVRGLADGTHHVRVELKSGYRSMFPEDPGYQLVDITANSAPKELEFFVTFI